MIYCFFQFSFNPDEHFSIDADITDVKCNCPYYFSSLEQWYIEVFIEIMNSHCLMYEIDKKCDVMKFV